ncbi:MAG: asparagine synthase (glutamine-hydrolyzing) [Nanoarchaeota archaeon]|nr:asparagine synthase (glutamine-hydrolyzing) [Nanoarchaeota archaeon]MBU1322263.1 asparagine synthase (glutamine-hydrolyzing) [Nanoarchaeota archaeon]MBU1598243.1 asparagine synthase (glutamine-hydrolyzing) [Nanoarchaeota archaeon]MBU2441996.1 asparagine synthase (glutamine-hydrolyzing) [Nanoarchaeota archaeon]
MCGIVGFNWEDKSLVRRMADAIKHRGPDDAAYFSDSGISFGMRRLSIIDLTKGIYPLTNENEDIFLVFNGEIYNFQKLRKILEEKGHEFKTDCDGEVIIHAYEEYKENFLKLLNGMFAICLYDKKSGELILARDRVGIKPLYYYFEKGNLIFASEIKSMLELSTIKREININSLNQYFALRYNPSYETLFQGINKLPPGHLIKFDLSEKSMIVSKYWDINLEKQSHKSARFYEKKLYELLKDSVKKRLISDVPLGAYLSGGLDSSALVALMSIIRKEENSDAPIRTYSVGFAKGEKVNETVYAKQVSELFGTTHKEFLIEPDVVKLLPKIVWHTDEPMADPALIPVYLLSEAAKKTSTVILTGDGGDEIFGGYDQYRVLKATHSASRIPLFRSLGPLAMRMIPLKAWNKFQKHASAIGKSTYRRGGLVMKSMKDDKARAYYELVGLFNEEERKELVKDNFFEPIDYNAINKNFFNTKRVDYMKQLQYFDFKKLLGESFLMKTDRMTMAQHIEARVPLLDHRIVELAFRMPSKYKLKGFSKTKYIFKRAMRKQLPKNIVYRKKQTFHVPIENWLDQDLKSTVDDLLNTTKLFNEKILDPHYVKKIRDNYNKGKLFYARQIWTLLNFELWHRMFIQREKIRL